jgi:hypothetical protein
VSGIAGWLDHLGPGDLARVDEIARTAGLEGDRHHHDEAALGAVLVHPSAFATVWGDGDGDGWGVPASPFLVFATAVHRAWADLQGARHVDEWIGARQRLPVLGGDDLRDFLADGERRLFLCALLASYTKVSSGSVWVRTARGVRRRRYSELDPVRLAGLLELVPPPERTGVYRRLGDLALFLTGVFPDHTELDDLGPLGVARLLRAGGVAPEEAAAALDSGRGGVDLFERLGRRWYRLASRSSPIAGPTATMLDELADHFALARRVLNVVTDRYLFPMRATWFGAPAD